MKALSIRSRIILPFGIIVLLILSLGFLLFSHHVRNLIDIDFNNSKENIMEVFYKDISSESEILNCYIDLIKVNKDIQTAWVLKDREQLFNLTKATNKTLLESFNITHFYFHGLDSVCFLRVHNPQRYGDVIDRFTLKGAVNDLTVTSGIELGSYGTFTLRVVSPWIVNGDLVGYVELGKEIGNITDKFNNILDIEIFFSIEKKFLNFEKWEEGVEMIGSDGSWDQMTNHVILGKNTDLLSPIFNFIDQLKRANNKMIISFSSKENYYRAGLIEAIDVNMQTVGDIIVLKDISIQQKSLNMALMYLVISSLFIALIGFILIWILLGRIQKKLDKANIDLVIKIKELKVSTNEAIESKSIAEKANSMKNDFLANISHELRTPLNGILGMTGLILDSDLDEDQKVFMQMIEESGDYLYRIISDLLDFSQIETGALTIKPVYFNLSNLVKNTISVLKPTAEKKNIKLLYSIKPEIINYYGDRVRVGQILINLITNSVKYSEHGEIKVNIELTEELEISIIDMGIGIASDKIHTIFDSFIQIENTYIKTHEGVGIGLSIVKHLVELLNGKINLESQLGVGTTFKITLPVVPPPSGVEVIPEKLF